MIEVEQIRKRYGGVTVLDRVSFAAGAGETVALLGANGAGKTTLLKCLLGLVRFEGTARVDGLDVRDAGKAVRRRIGYLPQAPAFPPHLAVGDTVEYYADLRGLRGEDIDARLEQVGLAGHEGKRVAALSGGLRQRLGLAVALLGDPPVLLMDEPVANLDPEGRRLFGALLAGLRGRGCTVLLSTHVFDLLGTIADRAVVVAEGRVAYDGAFDGLYGHGAADLDAQAAARTDGVNGGQGSLPFGLLEVGHHPIEDVLAPLGAGEEKVVA